MRIGIFAGTSSTSGNPDDVVVAAHTAAAEGFSSFWLPQIFGPDAITVAGVIGREIPSLEVGTAVVPTYPRHPMMLAQQALTASSLSGGHFTLGIGLSHQLVIEQIMGMSFDKPIRHMREYLSILRPLIHERTVAFTGETMSAHATIDIGDIAPCPILIAALASHTIPTITAAAERHGRPAPRVAAGIPICVTDDPARAKENAAATFAVYGILPSYRAMLDREGLEGPADMALVGTEDEVATGIERYRSAGLTDFLAVEFGDLDDQHRTRELLRGLL